MHALGHGAVRHGLAHEAHEEERLRQHGEQAAPEAQRVELPGLAVPRVVQRGHHLAVRARGPDDALLVGRVEVHKRGRERVHAVVDRADVLGGNNEVLGRHARGAGGRARRAGRGRGRGLTAAVQQRQILLLHGRVVLVLQQAVVDSGSVQPHEDREWAVGKEVTLQGRLQWRAAGWLVYEGRV